LRQAGEIMSGFPQAMQLRSLIALQGIAGDKSSTIYSPCRWKSPACSGSDG
jgi:hypothetical protein